jgi:hypothetical protein
MIFYMNYAEGCTSPTMKYQDKDQALQEAKRLALMLKKKVFTLMAVQCTEPAPEVIVTDLTVEETLPF